jgi:hypothetical protein
LKLPFSNFIQDKLGIDKAVAYVLLGRGFGIISLPVTLYVITRGMSGETQGYYYSFFNLLGVSIFLEMGLGIVLTQFASHEFASLQWTQERQLAGDPESLSRVFSILRTTLRWYGIMAVLYIAVLIPVGLVFFGAKENPGNVSYTMPWILIVLLTAVKLMFLPIQSVLEGCGKVASVQQVVTAQSIIGNFVLWAVLLLHGQLYALPALALSNLVVFLLWLWSYFGGFLRQIYCRNQVRILKPVRWRTEILPMQWRIALSWMAGYLITQLFNPLLLQYQTAVIAGQMGMTLQIANAIQTIALAWLGTRFPLFGALIQKKNYGELNRVLRRSTLQAFFVSMAASLAVLGVLYVCFHLFPNSKYETRILPLSALAWLLFSNIIGIPINAMAGFLRAHKEEPFLINSIVGAVLIASTAWICARYFDAERICISIALINLFVSLPLAWYIYRKKQRDWDVPQ